MMSLPDQFMIFLGHTCGGHHHEDSRLKHERSPEVDGLTDLKVCVDLGYRGLPADDRGAQMEVPHKKPRKSKKTPNPQLSEEQKAANKT